MDDYVNIVHLIQEILNKELNRSYEDGTEIYLGPDIFNYVYADARKNKPELPERSNIRRFTIRCRFGNFCFLPEERPGFNYDA